MTLSVSIGVEDCYHEAGHAAVFTYSGIPIEYVSVRPDLVNGYAGLVKPAIDTPATGRTELEKWMRCAAAGEVAKERRLGRSAPEDTKLITAFTRAARDITENPHSPRHHDMRNFAEAGLQRDREILQINEGPTGPASWVPIWRETEELVSGELWVAVQAVGEKLWAMVIANEGKPITDLPDLEGDEVAAIVSHAMSKG
jgi:hypothetical protein